MMLNMEGQDTVTEVKGINSVEIKSINKDLNTVSQRLDNRITDVTRVQPEIELNANTYTDTKQCILESQEIFRHMKLCHENSTSVDHIKVDELDVRRSSLVMPKEQDESLDTLPPMRPKSNSLPDTKALLAKRVEKARPRKALHRRDTPMDFSWAQEKDCTKQPRLFHKESLSEENETDDAQGPVESDCSERRNGASEKRKYFTRQDTPACPNIHPQKPIKAHLAPSCDALREEDDEEGEDEKHTVALNPSVGETVNA